MPVYDYRCPACGSRHSAFRPLAEYRHPFPCPCGAEAERLILAPAALPDYAGYESPVTGRWIEGRRAHQEELKRTGCRLVEKGETAEFKQRLGKRKEEFNRNVEQIVDLAARDLMN